LEINILKYLSFRRFINGVKIFASFGISKYLHKPVVWGTPISFSIEPTNLCNLECPECPSGLGTLTRPLGKLEMDNFKKFVDDIYKESFYLQLFFQGEPYMNKSLIEMINYAQSRKMYVSVSTNGHFITEKNVENIVRNAPDKLIYSVDGLDEESYKNYRVGGSFKKVDNGLRLLSETKKRLGSKRPYVEFQFIVMKQNEHLIDEVFKYGNKRDVDKVVLKTMQVSNYESGVNFLPLNEKYSRYIFDNGSIKLKNKLKNQCFALWRTSVITWDGKVVPCCFDKDADYSLGTLNGNSFKDVWNSAGYNNFRAEVLKNRKGIGMCTNCTEGLKMNIFEVEN
jgi:radical SAM protein with 4Fe4S-binding SPASM domain